MGAGVEGQLPRPAGDDLVLEDPGAIVKVCGRVEGHYRGRAVVQFPTAGGGAVGVPTDLEWLTVGDPVTLEGTVLEATREVLRVTFETPDGAGQEAALDRARCTFE